MNMPLYKKIYESVLAKIQSGELTHGDRIPSEKDLADQFKVSRITSKNALDLLAKENIIERVQGKGSFVKKSTPALEGTGEKTEKKLIKIGLVIPDFSDSYGALLIKSMEKYAAHYQATISIKITHEKMENEEKAIYDLLHAGVEGIIILPIHGEHYNQKILELVLGNFPIVLVDRYLRGILAHSISTDNLRAAEKATDYLFSLGHDEIAYITPPYDGTTVLEDRMRGFQYAYSKKDKILNPQYIFTNKIGEFIHNDARKKEFENEVEKIKQFIIDHPQITAFLACRHAFAEILEYVLRTMNKRIPEDYSIICFDSPKYFMEKPQFTHIHQKEEILGKRAIEVLLDQLNGNKNRETELVDFDLVEGLSTAKIYK